MLVILLKDGGHFPNTALNQRPNENLTLRENEFGLDGS
jgi:hypothetical protein